MINTLRKTKKIRNKFKKAKERNDKYTDLCLPFCEKNKCKNKVNSIYLQSTERSSNAF